MTIAPAAVALAALLALGAVVESAPARPTQSEILDRWAAALGGRPRLAAVRSVHMIARLEVGGREGRFETWYTARGQRHDLTEIPGLFRQEIIFDGARGWVRGASGQVRPLTGSELEDQVTSIFQATYAWLLPGRFPIDVVVSGETPDHSAWVLAIHPRHGTPYAVFLDRETFLPLRLEQHGLDRTTIQTLSNWREVAGIRFPWRARQTNGDPQLDLDFAIERIEFDAVLDPQLFTEPKAMPATTNGTRGAESPS
ncbi:MAG: hypothetical protein ABI609_01245 [Acidobacteriota bacterium]